MKETEPNDFAEYDLGYRQGVFDKCNGKPAEYHRADIRECLYVCGYFDGYDGNEVQIEQAVTRVEADEPAPMFRLWAEWDMGQDSLIFSTEDAAIHWADKQIAENADLEFDSFEDAKLEGLVSIEELKVID